jgi:NADPH:quinone reductase
VVIDVVGNRTAQIDLVGLYHNETRILGADSRKLDVVESARRLDRLSGDFERGDFPPMPITATYSLPEGPAAYQAVGRWYTAGRVVIQP